MIERGKNSGAYSERFTRNAERGQKLKLTDDELAFYDALGTNDSAVQVLGEPALTAMGVVVGTPDYIAPEQAVGGAVSKLSDLYSFGVVLFELLRGKKLFAAPEWAMDPVRPTSKAPV